MTSNVQDPKEPKEPLLFPEPETSAEPKEGGVSTPKTFLIIVKSFVASGVLFLPNAVRLGGIVFSGFSLTFVAIISTIAMIFLVQCKQSVGGTFGEIAEKAYGKVARVFVEVSLIASQLGFCAAYLVFVAELFEQFGAAIFNCSPTFRAIPFQVFIAVQFVIYAPLVWIRNMANFAIPSLVADAFIGLGLLVVMGYAGQSIAENGIHEPAYFAPTFAMFIGTAVYTFEGIGLILPIQDAMAHPASFGPLLWGTMSLLLVIFIAFSSLVYLAYGTGVQTIALLNMPDTKLAFAVLFLYALAMIATFPLQFFPATRIIESKVFPRHELFSELDSTSDYVVRYTPDTLPPQHQSGRISWSVTWKKNLMRAVIVAILVGIALVGSSQLDSFVSLIGAICCVPLAFIYPTLFHYKLVAQTKAIKALDIFIMTFGFLSLLGCTAITLWVWATETPTRFNPCPNRTNTTYFDTYLD